MAPAVPAAAVPSPTLAPTPTPTTSLDESTRRRPAVTAFAMGISTRQIKDRFRVILGDDGPDHATIGRWAADAAKKAKPISEAFDAACVPRVRALAIDEIVFEGDRPWSASSP